MWRYVISINLIALFWGAVLIADLPVMLAVLGTVLIFASLAGLFFFERMQARKGAKKIESMLSDQADSMSKGLRPDRQGEVEEMRELFDRELAALKSSKLGGGGSAALYSLPWYMIIGPPGGGKSTALRKSGLHFPTTRKGAIPGIGGTRNCDWWLTNEAVFLDTAGRYATQDEDRDEWLSFLEILKKARQKKPINGMLVAVPITELGDKGEQAVSKLAATLRARVDEVVSQLNLVVPVYVLFTKCDLLPGFVETFGMLRKSDREQILGTTFPIKKEGKPLLDDLGTRLMELVNRLRDRALMRMEEDRRVEVRERIFQFPQQFEMLCKNVNRFTTEFFESDVYQEAPILRGAYFTSGTQEGNPIDLLASSMASAFGIAPKIRHSDANPEPKSYFLRELFSDIIFPDRDVAVRSGRGKREVFLRRMATAGGLFVTAALLTILPLQAYFQNMEVIDSTEEIVREVIEERKVNADTVVPPSTLEVLRSRLAAFNEWEVDAPPLAMRYGMYQGATLYPYVRQFYVQLLQNELLVPIVKHDVNEMRTLNHIYGFNSRPSDPEYKRFFDKLKMHLLLTVPHAAGEPTLEGADREWLMTTIAARWGLGLGQEFDEKLHEAMKLHVSSYLDLLEGNPELAMARDKEAVKITRNLLSRVSYTEAMVKKIIGETAEQDRDLNLRRIMSGAVTPIDSDRGTSVRAAFTLWAWKTSIRERLADPALQQDRWVFGMGTGDHQQKQEAFASELRSEYLRRYIDEWREFIDSLRIKQPKDVRGSLEMMRELSRGQPSPLKRLMEAVALNTRLQSDEKSMAVKAAAAAKGAGGLFRSLQRRLGGRGVKGAIANAAARSAAGGLSRGGQRMVDLAAVESAFFGFYSFGYIPPAADGTPATQDAVPLDSAQQEYTFLRDALQTYVDNPSESAELLDRIKTSRSTLQGLLDLVDAGSGWRPRIETLVWNPIVYVTESLVTLKSNVGRRWCSEVVLPFMETLRGRYPFRASRSEVNLDDFSTFFRPRSGTLWSFYNSELKSDVMQSGSRFRFDGRMGGMVKRAYHGSLLTYLERVYKISRGLFPAGADDMQIEFDVKIRASPSFGVIAFDVAGESIEYRGGPEKWRRITWPGTDPTAGAILHVEGRGGIGDSWEMPGEWGLFRLFDAGSLVGAASGATFKVRWTSRRFKSNAVLEFRMIGASRKVLTAHRVGSRKKLRLGVSRLAPPMTIARGSPPCSL